MPRVKKDQSLHVTVTRADLIRLDVEVRRRDTSRSQIVREALRAHLDRAADRRVTGTAA